MFNLLNMLIFLFFFFVFQKSGGRLTFGVVLQSSEYSNHILLLSLLPTYIVIFQHTVHKHSKNSDE
jgi:hypothetical protein